MLFIVVKYVLFLKKVKDVYYLYYNNLPLDFF